MTDDALSRIAEALERLSPATPARADIAAHRAYVWADRRLAAARSFEPLPIDLLSAIDMQKSKLYDNTLRFAKGYAAHDVLLWGARGSGKSALVKSVIGAVAGDGLDIALVEVHANELGALSILFAELSDTERNFIVFIDDIGFDGDAGAARALRSVLEGGTEARPCNVRLYVTSNRRHIVPRSMAEQDDPINPRDARDDSLALSDRFGLSLGFHAASQADYLAMVDAYARYFGLDYEKSDALEWAARRGARSGRVAWQYIAELAGRAGRSLDVRR